MGRGSEGREEEEEEAGGKAIQGLDGDNGGQKLVAATGQGRKRGEKGAAMVRNSPTPTMPTQRHPQATLVPSQSAHTHVHRRNGALGPPIALQQRIRLEKEKEKW